MDAGGTRRRHAGGVSGPAPESEEVEAGSAPAPSGGHKNGRRRRSWMGYIAIA
jgi:hypothetical protein